MQINSANNVPIDEIIFSYLAIIAAKYHLHIPSEYQNPIS